MKTGSLEGRIIIQKIAYLLYRKGIETNYTDFSWYLHGVICWNLWYDVIRSWDVTPQDISAEVTYSVNSAKDSFRNASLTEYFSTSNGLELITTILFLAHKPEELKEDNKDLILDVLSHKNKYTEQEIRVAITKLRSLEWVNFK
jgi:hypothetical protein